MFGLDLEGQVGLSWLKMTSQWEYGGIKGSQGRDDIEDDSFAVGKWHPLDHGNWVLMLTSLEQQPEEFHSQGERNHQSLEIRQWDPHSCSSEMCFQGQNGNYTGGGRHWKAINPLEALLFPITAPSQEVVTPSLLLFPLPLQLSTWL